MIPEEVARRYCALPVERWSGQVVVAMANPNDVFALDDIRVLTGQSILAALADTGHLLAAIDRAYSGSDLIESSLDDAADDYDVEAEIGSGALVDDGPVVKLVNALLEKAVADRASDLHIEPASKNVMIRMRIDGILHDTSEAPLNVLRPMVSRLKVMGSLDISQNRLPQDGRFSLSVQGRPIDVRIATVPTAAGESVVLRLLDPVRGAMDLVEPRPLGVRERALRHRVPRAAGRDLRDRTDRIRKVVDALRADLVGQHARQEHRVGRGPGRVPARRRQADPDQHARRA